MPAADLERAPAKVNLYLHIVGKREDGYHLLDSLAVFPAMCDWLQATEADALSLSVIGPFAAGLEAEPDNLVLRAARLLAQEAGVTARARLVLHKNLPVASGIGGGSADAAAALRLLARFWGVPADPAFLRSIAARLGADVPVCLGSRPARMGGIGEWLQPAPALPNIGILLVNPRVSVATADVFRARSGAFSAAATLPWAFMNAEALVDTLRQTGNDLQAPAIGLCPVIQDVLDAIEASEGCLLARMSGSGATCFGLFRTDQEARLAGRCLKVDRWWQWGGGLSGPLAPP
ncbi:MAG: 4-(cytidine 5'-diphospho)-2-C-methyl-D-erythritol kinase [Acetobacteraceae bacterium]